jgi:xanthine dehydrogenase YagR molybdenum-binding subunit
VLLSIGGHEMGQGIRTTLTAAVARMLAVPLESVVVLVGDTRVAPQHPAFDLDAQFLRRLASRPPH